MKKENLRIVYMGTPDFAVEALRQLVEGGYNVVGVITMPDKPAGRGHKIQYSPVKQYALEQNLPLLQPEKLKDEAFVEALREWKADLQIVVAFRMLPEVVWNMPRLGTFNLHASLLPQYRGAAPINWAVINGDTETGITTFFLKHEIDTGEVIQQVRVPIADTDNVEVVHDKLMMLGGKLVLETVDAILNGTVKPIPQEGHIKKYLWVIVTFYESNIFLITCFMNKTLKLFYPFGIFCFWCDIGIIIKNRNFKILCQIFKNIAAARRAACMKEKSWAIFSLSTLLLNFIYDFIQYLLIIYFLNIICIHLNSPCNFISSKYP